MKASQLYICGNLFRKQIVLLELAIVFHQFCILPTHMRTHLYEGEDTSMNILSPLALIRCDEELNYCGCTNAVVLNSLSADRQSHYM